MGMRTTLRALFISIILAAFSSVSSAADGRVEINQASIEASGGFPLTITQPGSYVLTGPLNAPSETSAIVIESDFVAIDLNGFTITGPFVCEAPCMGGAADGIVTNGPIRYATVRNGQIRGFSDRCVHSSPTQGWNAYRYRIAAGWGYRPARQAASISITCSMSVTKEY